MRHTDAAVARIGPNAITRTAEAVRAQEGEATTVAMFRAAGLDGYLRQPPEAMVDEREVVALYRALRDTLGEAPARQAARDAGDRTAAYLLANRIPRAAQMVLRALPARLASPLLLGTIRGHAWTFAGSGQFSAKAGHPVLLSIAGCPICRGAQASAPVCDYYAATFERLFATLVSARARAQEVACAARGDPACVFAIQWRDSARPNPAG